MVALKNGEDHHSLCALLVDPQATMPEASQEELLANIRAAVDPAAPNMVVTATALTAFLTVVGEYYLMPEIGSQEYAEKIIGAGYTTSHAIAELGVDELRGLGLKPAHAKNVGKHLGASSGDADHRGAAAPSVAASDAATAMGTALAEALSDQKPTSMLAGGSDERPSIAAGFAWLKVHSTAQSKSAFPLDIPFSEMTKDCQVDLEPYLLAEPMSSSDKAYYRRVKMSLTPEQYDNYGSGEKVSACKLAQNVLKALVKTSQRVFNKKYDTFKDIKQSVEPTAVKQRFNMYTEKLIEIRFHSAFELEEAVEKLVEVIHPHTSLSFQVWAEWAASAKDQRSLSILLKSTKQKLIDRHEDACKKAPPKDKNTTQHSSTPDRNWKKPKPWSAQSASDRNKKSGDKNVCYSFQKYGQCMRGASCNFNHTENKQPQIHQIVASQVQRKLNVEVQGQIREALEAQREQMMQDFNEAREADMAMWAAMMSPGARLAQVLAVTRSRSQVKRKKALTEMQRLVKARSDAKASSPCHLLKGPVIDSATDTDVIAGCDEKHAVNVSKVAEQSYGTVGGSAHTDKVGDLVTPLVTLHDAPVLPKAASSIVSHKSLFAAGFTVVSCSKFTALVRDNVAHLAVPDGNFCRLPTVPRRVVDAEINAAIAVGRKANMQREKLKILLHRKRSHRPKDPLCDDCVQGQMVRAAAKRRGNSATHTGADRGLTGGLDFIVNLPPDNNGCVSALGLTVSGVNANGERFTVAHYQPVKGHTADEAVKAYDTCESAVLLLKCKPGAVVGRVHSDCDPTLLGEKLVSHLRNKGVWQTSTEGYDHNGNAAIESRNRQVQAGMRSSLLTATGGRCRYTHIWGETLMNVNDCIDNTANAGESSPVERAGGMKYDVEGDNSHVLGAKVFRYEAKERRDEKQEEVCT